MSYILEALKKADADRERERSAVPSLHAHTDALGFERERRGGAALGVKLGTGAALLLAGGGALWWWLQPAPPVDPPPLASAMPAPAPAPMPLAAPPAALPVQVPAPPPAAPVVAAPPAPAPPPALPARKPAATAPAPAAPAPAPERVPTRNELPSELRAALPPLNVSGAVYAPAPGSRMLFVNGLVLREGDAVTDGLNVERIGRASSVLVFRGQRFELKH